MKFWGAYVLIYPNGVGGLNTESYSKYFKIWENGALRQMMLSLTLEVKFKVYKR